MKVGDKIWEVKINKLYSTIRSDGNFTWGLEDGVEVKEYSILGVSHMKVVLDEPNFSSYGYRHIDNIVVDIRTDNHFAGDGVFVSLISISPPDKHLLSRMVAEAESEVKRRYGWLADFAAGLNNLIEEY